MLLLVGLGNPGTAYAKHRHNIGFMAVERIAAAYHFERPRERFSGLLSSGRIDEREAIIFKPMTSMNLSGPAVAKALRHYREGAENMVVFHDELDLPLGKIRMKAKGGTAGHNGLRSLAAHIPQDFRRARLGIGHPGHAALVQRHVLGNFRPEEQTILQPLLDAIASAADCLARNEDSNFANRVHLAMRPLIKNGL